MPVTCADFRALLVMALLHGENPAILRLKEGGCTFSPDCQEGVSCFRGEPSRAWCDSHIVTERTVEGLVTAYLSRTLWAKQRKGADWIGTHFALINIKAQSYPIVLTERGTAHALLVALTLALGFDPGVDGLAVRWVACNGGGWMLQADNPQHDPNYDASRFFTAAMTGHEAVPVRALEFAVRYVLTVEGSNA